MTSDARAAQGGNATETGPDIRPSLQFAFGPDRRLGPGKIALLEGIMATGSISAAGRGMGMSYRRAWLLVDALNRIFAEPVVVAAAGGAKGGGAQVTETGRRLVATYRAIEKRTLRDARASFAEFAFRETPSPSP